MPLFLITFFLSFSVWGKSAQKLEREAFQSIQGYFQSSNRELKRLRWVDLTLVNRQKQEYLVEAEVLAQKNPLSSGLALYHCGVFSRLAGQSWQTQMTSCQLFSDEYYPQP